MDRTVTTSSFLITFLIMFVSLFSVSSQENIRFHAYGKTPKSVNDSLYKALFNSTNTNQKLDLLYRIGEEHLKAGDVDSVIKYGNQIKELYLKPKLGTKEAQLYKVKAYFLLGKGKFLNGLFDESLKTYLEALELTKELKITDETDIIKLGLGEVYLQKGDLTNASSIFTKLLANTIDNGIYVKANFYLGVIAFDKDDLPLAKEHYNEAQSKLEEESSKINQWIQLYLGRLAAKEDKNNIAFGIYESIMGIALENSYFDVYTEAVLEYGKICAKLEQYQIAEMVLATAYTNAIQWNRLELQKKIINSLRLTYQAKGDFENAYNLMTQYNSVSNQIIRQQNSKVIKEIEIKYQTLEKENQIYELKEEQLSKQNEIERQKTIKKAFLYGFLALLIPIVALLFVYYQKLQTQSMLNNQQEELNSQKIAALLNAQELELIRTSLDAQQEERHRIAKQLHDSIGGNLAGIKLQLANLKGSKKFQKEVINQVNETYEMVREISHDLVPKKFNQEAFVHIIENYIFQLQKNTEIEITFSAHPKEQINDLSEKLRVEIYQILQELFTNTIKHANATTIEVHLNIHDTVLQLIFEDNGKGFEVKNLRKGIGLQNIENRLNTLNGKLLLDSALKRGTVININIPLKN
ncbi:hypothetical protein MTsPCn9_28940 [Croceitalea sp. MTPC9]|uniref:tetratricopeptide repeat-containing sensor histidine kinase n=1 Tax=unclassified Croceitalea TaxID=2632280 RepID=UPI002B37A394|nr:hypothetical protein MTsPCn6_30430 [Croceitalea sp. MTPC6]GMN17954.1 hypothetical protein MTsPCn9_28940 [Croceitalea sp. MTPC9]